MEAVYKFGAPEPEQREWTYNNAWATDELIGGVARIVVAPASDQIKHLRSLLKEMTGPFWILYVLVVPRCGGEAGRYQSPEPLPLDQIEVFLNEFTDFFEKDGRHNVWIASESGSETLVYDRHNVIYGYGPLAAWKQTLEAKGFKELPAIRFPDPHSHHYHQAFDDEEKRLLNHWDWRHTPLRASDEE